MNKEIYRQQLIRKIDEKRQELQNRKERLIENTLAGLCNKSIFVTTQNELRVAPTLILLCERPNQSKPQHFNNNKQKIMRKT